MPIKTLVVYIGRFQPFHNGHLSVYNSLINKYGKESVCIITSDPKAIDLRNPFTFDQKKEMIEACGINKVFPMMGSGYSAIAIGRTTGVELTNTVLVVAVGEKDADRLKGNFYKGLYDDFKYHDTMDAAGYFEVIQNYDGEEGVLSATEIREYIHQGIIRRIQNVVPKGVYKWLIINNIIEDNLNEAE